MKSILGDSTSYLTRLEAINFAAGTGQTAILLKGQAVVVPEATIQMFLTKQVRFAFLKSHDGIITAVPMN